MSRTRNTTRVTIFVCKDDTALPVRISARIPKTEGAASWIANADIIRPGEANTYYLGEAQDLVVGEVRG